MSRPQAASADFAVIFDMDGVLVDSGEAIRRSFEHVLKSYGIEDMPRLHRGRSLRDVIAEWNNELGTAIDHEHFSRQAAEIEMAELRQKPQNAHLLALLRELREGAVPLAVGTASMSFRTWEILDVLDIRGLFSAVVTADDVQAHKPDPAVFLAAAEQLVVAPDRCIVIEDSALGIEAAHRGGMKAIGFAAYHGEPESLKHADVLVHDFAELSYERLLVLAAD
ncbi:HAD family phosphatase [Candidatus Berkelbacteria bacterium]|nr:HAD family phosphatase [Candidatus Berkelbacteria bacterium]